MNEKWDNSGSLSKNDGKDDDHPNWPDYRGRALIDGVEYWISAWIKQGPKGKFLSLAFKPKEEIKSKPASKAFGETDFDDNIDIPF